jgi:antirestriction protein ArdC
VPWQRAPDQNIPSGTRLPSAAHASYIANWIKPLKDDKREIFRAAADAQRIADMELGFHPDYAAEVQAELSAVPG